MDSRKKSGSGHKLTSIKQDLDRCGVLFQAIKDSNFDKDFKDQFWWIEDVSIIENARLVQKFKTTQEKFRKLERTDEQMKEVFVFSVERERSLEEIARDGSKVVAKKRHVLGYTGSGIHLVRHYDILTRYMFHQQFPSPSFVVIYKAILGKAKPIVPRIHKEDSYVEPCVGFDCHISARRVESHMPISEALNCSYVYFYEHSEGSSSPVKYPRQVLPFAVIKIETKKHLSMARTAPMFAVKTNDVQSAIEVKGETRRGFRFTYHKPSKTENLKKKPHEGLKINTLKEQLLEMRTKQSTSSKRVDVHSKMDHKTEKKKDKEKGANGGSQSMTVQYEGEKFCLSPVVEKDRGKIIPRVYTANVIDINKKPDIQIKMIENKSDVKSNKTLKEAENTPCSKFKQNHKKLPLSLKPFIALKRLNSQEVNSNVSKKTQQSENKQYNSNGSMSHEPFKDPFSFSDDEIIDQSGKIRNGMISNEKSSTVSKFINEFDKNYDKTAQSGKRESPSDNRRNESWKSMAHTEESAITQINVSQHKHYESSFPSSNQNEHDNGSKKFVKPTLTSRSFDMFPETNNNECYKNTTPNIACQTNMSREACSESVEEIKRNNEIPKSCTATESNKSNGSLKNVQMESAKRKNDTATTSVMVKKLCTGNNSYSRKTTHKNVSLKKYDDKERQPKDKSLSKCIEHGRMTSKISSHSLKTVETLKSCKGNSKGAYEKELKIVKDPANVCIFSKSEKENKANKNVKKFYKRADHIKKPSKTHTKRKTINVPLSSREKKEMPVVSSRNEKEQINSASQKNDTNSNNKSLKKSSSTHQNKEPAVCHSLQTNGEDNSTSDTTSDTNCTEQLGINDMTNQRSSALKNVSSKHNRDHLVLEDFNKSSKMEVMNTSDSRGHSTSVVMESHNYARKLPCIANPVTSLPMPPPDYSPVTTVADIACTQLADGPKISSPLALKEVTQVNSFSLISPPVTIKQRIPRAHSDKGKHISFQLNSDENKQNSSPSLPVMSANSAIDEQPVNLSIVGEKIHNVMTHRLSSEISVTDISEKSSNTSQCEVKEFQLLASINGTPGDTSEEKPILVRNISPLKVDLTDVKKLQKLLISNFNEARKLNLVGNTSKSVSNEQNPEKDMENCSFAYVTGNEGIENDNCTTEKNAFPGVSNEESQTAAHIADKNDNVRKDIHDNASHDTLIDMQPVPVLVNHVDSMNVEEKTDYVYTLASMHPPQEDEYHSSIISVKHEDNQRSALTEQYLYQPSVQSMYDTQQPSLNGMQPVSVKQELVEHVKEEPETLPCTEKDPVFPEEETITLNDVMTSSNAELCGTNTGSENYKAFNSGEAEEIICKVSEVKCEHGIFQEHVSESSDTYDNRKQEKEIPTTEVLKSYFDHFKREDAERSAKSVKGSRRAILKSLQELSDDLQCIQNGVRTQIVNNTEASHLKPTECVNVCISGENLPPVNDENNLRQRGIAEVKKSQIKKSQIKCSIKRSNTEPNKFRLNNSRDMSKIRNETGNLISKEKTSHVPKLNVFKNEDHAKKSFTRNINTNRELKTCHINTAVKQKAAKLPLKTQSKSLTFSYISDIESDEGSCLETNHCHGSSNMTGPTAADNSSITTQVRNRNINSDMQVKSFRSEQNSEIKYVNDDKQLESINGEQNSQVNKRSDKNGGKTILANTLNTGDLVESRLTENHFDDNSVGEKASNPVSENDNQIVSVHNKTKYKTGSRNSKRRTYDDIIPFDVLMKKRKEQYIKFKRGESNVRFLTYRMLKKEFPEVHGKSESSTKQKERDIRSKDKYDIHRVVWDKRTAPNEASSLEKKVETLPSSENGRGQKRAQSFKRMETSKDHASTLAKTQNPKDDTRKNRSEVLSSVAASNKSSSSKEYNSLSISVNANKSRLPDTPRKINENVSPVQCPESSDQNGTEKDTSNQKRKRSRSVSLDRSENCAQAKKLKFDDQKQTNTGTSSKNTINSSDKAKMTGFFHWRRKYAPRLNCVNKKDRHQTSKDFDTWQMIKERERIRLQIENAINDYKRTFQRTGGKEDGNDKVVNYLNYLSTSLGKQENKSANGTCSNILRQNGKGRYRPKNRKPKKKKSKPFSKLDNGQKNMGKNNVETLVESLLTIHSNRDSYRHNSFGHILKKQMIEHVGQISSQILKELQLKMNSPVNDNDERKSNGKQHICRTGETCLPHCTDNSPIFSSSDQKKNEERSTNEAIHELHNYPDENKRKDTSDYINKRKSQRDDENYKDISPNRRYELDAFMKSDEMERYCDYYNERFTGDGRLRDSDSVVNNNEWTRHDSSAFKRTDHRLYGRLDDRTGSIRYDEKRPHRLKSYPDERGEQWSRKCTSERFENDWSHRTVRDNIRNDNLERRSYDRYEYPLDESYCRSYSDCSNEDRRYIRGRDSLENTDHYSYSSSSRWSRRNDYSYDESGAFSKTFDADYDARWTTSETYYVESIREDTRGSYDRYSSSDLRYIPERHEMDGRYRSEGCNRRSSGTTYYENGKKVYSEDTIRGSDSYTHTRDESRHKRANERVMHGSYKSASVEKNRSSSRESKSNMQICENDPASAKFCNQSVNKDNRPLPNRNDGSFLPSDISSRSTRSTKSRSPISTKDRSPVLNRSVSDFPAKERTSLKTHDKTSSLENGDVQMGTESPKHSWDRSLPTRSKSPINRKVSSLIKKTNRGVSLRREKSPTVHRNKSPSYVVDNSPIDTKMEGSVFITNNRIAETVDSPKPILETNSANADDLDIEDSAEKLQTTISRIISSMKYPYPSASS